MLDYLNRWRKLRSKAFGESAKNLRGLRRNFSNFRSKWPFLGCSSAEADASLSLADPSAVVFPVVIDIFALSDGMTAGRI